MAQVITIPVIDASGDTDNIPVVPANLLRASIDFSAGGSTQIVVGVSGQTIKGYRLTLQVAAATTIELLDGAGVIDGPYVLGAGGSLTFALEKYAHWEGGAGNAFSINSSNAVQVTGYLRYLQS